MWVHNLSKCRIIANNFVKELRFARFYEIFCLKPDYGQEFSKSYFFSTKLNLTLKLKRSTKFPQIISKWWTWLLLQHCFGNAMPSNGMEWKIIVSKHHTALLQFYIVLQSYGELQGLPLSRTQISSFCDQEWGWMRGEVQIEL